MANDLFTDGGKIIKMEVDYNETVTEKLPVCQKLAKVDSVNLVFMILTLLLFVGRETHRGFEYSSGSREANSNGKYIGYGRFLGANIFG